MNKYVVVLNHKMAKERKVITVEAKDLKGAKIEAKVQARNIYHVSSVTNTSKRYEVSNDGDLGNSDLK